MKYNIPDCIYTHAPINRKVVKAFAKGCKGKLVSVNQLNSGEVATYGIKRGTANVMSTSKRFWYIDHGYFGYSIDFNGYYRIVMNHIIHDKEGNFPSDRFDKFNFELKPWQKSGRNIILSPPSLPMGKFIGYERNNWIYNVTEQLKKYTDRPIIISEKTKNPFSILVNDAWVLITDHSNVQIDALIAGIPIITTSRFRKIGHICDVENPIYDRSWLKNLAYKQWTLKQMESGQAWKELNELY